MKLRYAGRNFLHLALYIIGGLGSLLSYLLIIRMARIQYTYQYVPVTAYPVLFTPIMDVVIWAASTVTLATIGFRRYWKENRRYRAFTLAALISATALTYTMTILYPSTRPYAIALSWIPLIHLVYKPLSGLSRGRCLQAAAYSIAAVWLFVEAGSAVFLALHRERVYPFPLYFERKIASLSVNLMYSLQPASTRLLLALGFSWIGLPVFAWINKRKKSKSDSTLEPVWLGPTILIMALTLSIVAISVPFIRNPEFFGVDTEYYLNRLTSIEKFEHLIRLLPGDPRLLYLILLKTLCLAGASPQLSIKLGPLLLTALNAFAFYFLAAEIADSRLAGGLAGAFAALGMQTSISLYAGIYANWLTLSLGASATTIYLKAAKTGKLPYLAPTYILTILCLAAHPWSGVVFASILLLASLLDAASSRLKNKRLTLVSLLTASMIGLTLAAGYLYPPFKGYARSVENLLPSFNPSNLNSLIFNLSFNMDYMVGGFMSAPILYLASLIGFSALSLEKGNSRATRLASIWLAITITPILLAEQWLQWRLIYITPIQLLSGLGVYYLTRFLINSHERSQRGLAILILLTIILAMFNYLLRNVAFLPSV
ncbi:MAG: hypothetical protein QXO32_08470 [Candidatus Bathyarchaeia archaeon]